ncbi:hypothetical protein JCM17960_14060 [Magnetospira thiophila]
MSMLENTPEPAAPVRKARPARIVRKTDDRQIADLYGQYAAPVGETRGIQIVRPFSVLSATTYSAAILPPLGLAYLASVLRKAGYGVGIVDAQGEDIFNLRLSECERYNLQGLGTEALIDRIAPDTLVVGVSLMFSQEWPPQRDFILALRERFPDVVIVAGGEHPTAFPEYTLRDCPAIDFVVTGEGELTFLELVYRLFHGLAAKESPGISYLNENGAYVSNGYSDRITHLDDLPRPAWDLCQVENYFQPNWAMGINMGRHIPILATRGCPYQCTFCSNPVMWTTRYKMRDAKDVAAEIEELVSTYHVDSIDFFDLTAIVKKDWTLEFCDELKRRKLKITWQLPSGTRSEALDQDTLQALWDTGCRLITYAPESGSQRTLELIKKKLKLPHIVESIRIAKSVGHTVKINLVMGFPGEKLSDIFKTVGFGIKMAWMGADDCNIAIFSPYPGSELYAQLLAEGKLPPPSDDYFASLLVYFDLTKSISYCENASGRTLAWLRILILMSFYSLAYLRHPRRIWRVVRSMTGKNPFRPSNVLEQRLFDIFARKKRVAAK